MTKPIPSFNVKQPGLLTSDGTPYQFRPDGCVLVSFGHDRMYRLNGVGAMAWDVLASSQQGLTATELAYQMAILFEAINNAGHYHFDVPLTQLRSDITRLLEIGTRFRLLSLTTDQIGRQIYSVLDDVSQTPSQVEAALRQDDAVEGESEIFLDEDAGSCSGLDTFTAFVALGLFDTVSKLVGFGKFMELVQSRRAVEARRVDRHLLKRVCAAVNRAEIYYPKKVMCLQRSSVLTCLLRWHGMPAEMVLAAQDFPTQAHAWVEVEGRVVNDNPSVKSRYSVIKRV